MTNATNQEPGEGVVEVHIPTEVGIVVQSLMFRRRQQLSDLGAVIGNSKPNVSRKLRGQVAFTVADLYKIAKHYEVDVEQLLPRMDSNHQPCD